MSKRFNFNNEEHTLAINVDPNGRVSFEVNGVTHTCGSVQELAENYALARDVKPENLKNWVLLEDGDTYSYVLRAATAGADFFDESDESDDTNDEDDTRYDSLSYEEYEIAHYLYRLDDYELEISELVNTDDEFYELVINMADEYASRPFPNVHFNIELDEVIYSIENGEVPTNEIDAANRAITVAGIARRDGLQIAVYNIKTDEVSARYRVEMFRPSELVVKINDRFVLITK